MDVTLHIGAHRTASTSFQAYMHAHAARLSAMGVGYWGPHRLRRGMFHGILPNRALGIGPAAFARAQGRLKLHMQRSAGRDLTHLVVSDENILGTMRANLRSAALYPAAGERIARFVAAFDGQATQIGLQIRSLDSYWASALSFCIGRGLSVPTNGRLTRLVAQPRNWRDVITDIAAAAPQAKLVVSSFERCAAGPEHLLGAWIGQPAPHSGDLIWRNRRPAIHDLLRLELPAQDVDRLQQARHDGYWCPFTPQQSAQLRERYADDLFWLRAGADGYATFLEDPKAAQTGIPPPSGFAMKGQRHDTARRLARPG